MKLPVPASSPAAANDLGPVDDRGALGRLRRNRAFATGLLGAMAVVFVATHWVAHPGFATLLLRSAADAGLVGGLADWFAVTALFRHPLGVPAPHTAIIPNSKDRIARTLGRFIERHFLTAEAVLAKLRSVRVGHRLATWLARRSNSDAVADAIVTGLPYVIRSLEDRELLTFANRTLGRQLRHADFAPILGRVLQALAVSGEADIVFDRALEVARRLLEENRGHIERLVQQRSRWWVPSAVDRRITVAIISDILRILDDLQSPDSEARQRFRASLEALVDSLQSSPEQREQINAAKNRLLDHPDVQAWIASIWTDLSTLTLQDLQSPSSRARASLRRGLALFGRALAEDEAMQKELDSVLEHAAIYLVAWRGEVGSFFSDVVRNWDAEALSSRLELVVGSDLQYIRMNGTIVGALVGCLLFLATRAIS